MKQTLLKVAMTAALLCCAASAGAETHADPVTKDGFTPQQQADIGKIAGDYLLAHPEILLQVSQKLQAQQAERLSLSMRTAAVKLQGALTTDPDVPSVGPVDARVAVIEFFDYQCVYCNRSGQAAMALLASAGIPVRTVSAFRIMHYKTLVTDGRNVETGSYNFSRSAARNNSENALLLKDMPSVAQQYLVHWQSRWDMGTDWSPAN